MTEYGKELFQNVLWVCIILKIGKKAPKKICDYLNYNSTMEEYQQIEQYFNRIAPYSDKLENRKVADLFT